jgi:hypothetical protein
MRTRIGNTLLIWGPCTRGERMTEKQKTPVPSRRRFLIRGMSWMVAARC